MWGLTVGRGEKEEQLGQHNSINNKKKILKDFIYLFLEGKGWRKRRREISMCGWHLCAPYWGPGLPPRPVP